MNFQHAWFIASAVAVSPAASQAQHPERVPHRPVVLTWQQSADLPDPVGLKGMFAGISEGHVLLAGGTNFPVPQRAGGRKAFHRAIYFRPVKADDAEGWTK